MISPTKFCFVDLETTGIDPGKNGIIQIAGIVCRNENFSLIVLEEFAFNVAPFPRDKIQSEALSIAGVSMEQITTYEKPDCVHSKLTQLLGQYCDKYNKRDKMFLLGYNVQFDSAFLHAWFEKAGDEYFGSWFWSPPIDVMSIAALHLAERRDEMPDFKLSTVAKWMNVDLSTAHNALADIRATKEIFVRAVS